MGTIKMIAWFHNSLAAAITQHWPRESNPDTKRYMESSQVVVYTLQLLAESLV